MLEAEVSGSPEKDCFEVGSGERFIFLYSVASLRTLVVVLSTRLYAGGELQGSPVWQALAGHKRRIPLAVVLPRPDRGAGTLIPSAQRLVWAAKQALGKAALGALFA